MSGKMIAVVGMVLGLSQLGTKAQAQRPINPYANELEELRGQKRQLENEKSRLGVEKERLINAIQKYNSKVADFNTRQEANNRLGKAISRTSNPRRYYYRYLEKCRKLDGERDQLDQEKAHLKRWMASVNASIDALNYRQSHLQERETALGKASGSGSSGGGLIFDESAPKRR